MPLIQINADLTAIAACLKRIAEALELYLYREYGIQSDWIDQKLGQMDPEGTEIEYYDHDQATVEEEMRKLGYITEDEPEL